MCRGEDGARQGWREKQKDREGTSRVFTTQSPTSYLFDKGGSADDSSPHPLPQSLVPHFLFSFGASDLLHNLVVSHVWQAEEKGGEMRSSTKAVPQVDVCTALRRGAGRASMTVRASL